MAFQHDPIRPSRDVRHQHVEPWLEEPDDQEIEERIDQLIEAIHSRLLQSATRGRLTFQGDRIVPGPACAKPASTPESPHTQAAVRPDATASHSVKG